MVLIVSKTEIVFFINHDSTRSIDKDKIQELKKSILQPLNIFSRYKDYTNDEDVNPHFIKPKMFMFRLQKIMDEYAGGTGTGFKTSEALLEKALEFLQFMHEDSAKLAASDLHELMRCWENVHRLWQAEAHIRSVLFREETRWPGYYFRTDFPEIKKDWKCFTNCRWNTETGKWEMMKKEIIELT